MQQEVTSFVTLKSEGRLQYIWATVTPKTIIVRTPRAVRSNGHTYGVVDTSTLKKDDYTACLESLSALGYNPRKGTIELAHQESFKWIWDEGSTGPGFVDWLKHDTGIYWISGKPGAGKSTLMRYIYDDERVKDFLPAADGRTIMAGYFFHDLGQSQEKTLDGFLAGVLYQLVSQERDLFKFVRPVLSTLGRGSERLPIWHSSSLEAALRSISSQREIKATVCIFIDGYDECGDEAARRAQLDEFLIPWIEQTKGGPFSIKACLSSRRLQEIELYLSGYPGFRIHERTAEDISKYVTFKLNRTTALLATKHKNKNFRAKVRDQLIQNIVDKAEGVFLWVKLVVKDISLGLEAGNTDLELQRRLDVLPIGIKDLYAKIIGDLDPNYLHTTWTYLQMLCRVEVRQPTLLDYSFVEESLEEISRYRYTAYLRETPLQDRCDKTLDRVQSRCGVLLEVQAVRATGRSRSRSDGKEASGDESYLSGDGFIQVRSSHYDAANTPLGINRMVSFVHRTVKEYFQDMETNKMLLKRIDPDLIVNSDLALLKGCLGSLISNHSWWPPWKDVIPQYVWYSISPLLHYARALDKNTNIQYKPYIDLLDDIYSSADKHWQDDYQRESSDIRMKAKSKHAADMLSLTVTWGLTRYISQALGEEGASVHRADKTPLLIHAVQSYGLRSLTTMTTLFDFGALPQEQDFDGRTCWEYALFMCAPTNEAYYSTCSKTIDLFLEKGANPNCELRNWPSQGDWRGGDSDSGSEEFKESFLKKRGKFLFLRPLHGVIMSEPFGRVMQRSAEWQDFTKDLITILLQHGADPTLTNSDGEDVFQVAHRVDPKIEAYIRDYWKENEAQASAPPVLKADHSSGSKKSALKSVVTHMTAWTKKKGKLKKNGNLGER